MKSWKIKFRYDYLGPENEYGKRQQVERTLDFIIVSEHKSMAVAQITQVYGYSDTFKILSVDPGPEIYAIISVNHGMGPVNR